MLLVSRLRVTVTPAAARCTVYKPHINDTGGMYTHTTQTLQKTRIQDLLYTVVTLYIKSEHVGRMGYIASSFSWNIFIDTTSWYSVCM